MLISVKLWGMFGPMKANSLWQPPFFPSLEDLSESPQSCYRTSTLQHAPKACVLCFINILSV